jgi:hypothetical protein
MNRDYSLDTLGGVSPHGCRKVRELGRWIAEIGGLALAISVILAGSNVTENPWVRAAISAMALGVVLTIGGQVGVLLQKEPQLAIRGGNEAEFQDYYGTAEREGDRWEYQTLLKISNPHQREAHRCRVHIAALHGKPDYQPTILPLRLPWTSRSYELDLGPHTEAAVILSEIIHRRAKAVGKPSTSPPPENTCDFEGPISPTFGVDIDVTIEARAEGYETAVRRFRLIDPKDEGLPTYLNLEPLD